MWTRKKNNSNREPYKNIDVKFTTSCAKCAVRVEAKSKAFYDLAAKRVVCGSCVALIKKGMEPVIPPSAAQITIDRLKQILSTGGPNNEQRSEFEQLINSLKVEYASERLAQSFLADVHDVPQTSSFICMSIRRADTCNGCAERLSGGTVAVWDKDAHRVWCLSCAADFSLD